MRNRFVYRRHFAILLTITACCLTSCSGGGRLSIADLEDMNVKINRELEVFFGELDEMSSTMETSGLR